jgi:hypothetical protein
MIVESANPIAVIRFARNGKIARRALGIVVLALIRPYVVMLHVMVKKLALRVQATVAIALLQNQYVGMGLVMDPRNAIHAQKIVANALPQIQIVPT